nr:alpha/beta hydrolase [Sinorhizobium sp. Sb3]
MLRTALIAGVLLMSGTAFAEAETVEVNGMKMYYEVSGEGEPLVVLHGAYMNIPSMGAIIPKLAETHKVYAIELQGHGRTTDIDRPITYPNLADDVAAFMDAVDLKKADVFGYSMGAAAGLQLAIRHPEKVNKLAAASVGYDAEGWQPEFKAFIPQMTVEMFVGMPFAEDYRSSPPIRMAFQIWSRSLSSSKKNRWPGRRTSRR